MISFIYYIDLLLELLVSVSSLHNQSKLGQKGRRENKRFQRLFFMEVKFLGTLVRKDIFCQFSKSKKITDDKDKVIISSHSLSDYFFTFLVRNTRNVYLLFIQMQTIISLQSK